MGIVHTGALHGNKHCFKHCLLLMYCVPLVYSVMYIHFVIVHIMDVLMRDEKEGRKKQARSNKQQGKAIQHTQGSHFYLEK